MNWLDMLTTYVLGVTIFVAGMILGAVWAHVIWSRAGTKKRR